MKKLLLFFVLFVFASISSYPQNFNAQLTSPALSPLSNNTKSPVQGKLPLLPGELLKKRLNKTNGTAYKPLEVIADNKTKETYTYDSRGNLISLLTEENRSGDWFKLTRELMEYDANCNVTSSVSEKWTDGSWVTSESYSYTYNSTGHILNFIYKGYENGAVSFSARGTYTYNDKGKMLTNVWETEIDGSWIIIDRYTNTYDAAGNLAVSLYEKMEFITTTMTNNSRTTFTYDAKGNMLTELGETWQNGAWQNSYRETYTYDGKNNMTGYLSETWKGGAWENLKKGTHGYNSNNNLLTSIWEDFLNGAWVKSFKISYTYYNTNGSILNELTEQWLNGTWGNYSKRVYSYDSHGNAVKGESFAYTGASTWAPQSNNLAIQYNNADDILNVSGSSVVVTYTGISGVEDIAITARKYDLAQNYPNPFNPSTTISYSLKKEGNVKLTVYDALGKIVAVVVDEFKPAGSYSAKFDARSLPSGIYIYRLEAGEFSAAKKFILMK